MRLKTSSLAVGVAVGLVTVLSACSSGSAETVTVTQQVEASAPAAPANSPSDPPAEPSSPSAPSNTPSVEESSSSAPPATRSTDGAGSPVQSTDEPTTSSSKPKPSKSSRPATKSGNPDPGYTIPTANDPNVSRDVPGPDGGRKCATNADYYDEAPTGLRPDVIAAWHHFEKVANAQGLIVCLNDGKRSRAQQQAQYDEYVKEYGKEVADQLVLTPDKSSHVTGTAIDVQPAAAYQFLQGTKGGLGFCRIYDNEPWHFEYDVAYFTQGCPPRLPKPEH